MFLLLRPFFNQNNVWILTCLKKYILIQANMDYFEKEFERISPAFKRLGRGALFAKKVVVYKRENFVEKGSNIIVGNHIGSFKDIAVLLEIVPRPIFFTANREIFDKNDFSRLIRKHLKRHLKGFGDFLDLILKPLKSPFVNFVSHNIMKIGTIPVDLTKRKGIALRKGQEYVEAGRAIVLLQGRGRIMNYESNPYVSRFRRGASLISYNMYKEKGISVPVTPLAIFGTHFPFLVPRKIEVNIGKPLYIDEFINDEFNQTINNFTLALEKQVKILLYEMIKKS